MAQNPGVTVYPTAISFNWHTYTGPYYHGGGDGYGRYGPSPPGGENANTDGDTPKGGRGASYFFGFLISLVVLLLIAVCCGLASRRRYLANQRQRRMDELMEQAEGVRAGNRFLGFGGLMSGPGEEGGKGAEKPRFHEVSLNNPAKGKGFVNHEVVDLEEQALPPYEERDSDRMASPSWDWRSITPLSASIVRLPKDFNPYEHFDRVTSDRTVAAPHYANQGPVERQEANQSRWVPPLLSTWGPFKKPIISDRRAPNSSNEIYQLSTLSASGSQSASSSDSSVTLRQDAPATRTASTSSITANDAAYIPHVEVAVVVAMPEEVNSKQRSGRFVRAPSPEYQIGLTTASLAPHA